MKKYEVIYTSKAKQRIKEIIQQIIDDYDDDLAAAKVYHKIEKRCESLSVLPGISSVKLEVGHLQLRFTRAGKYIVVYSTDDVTKTVVIHTVLHSRQDIIKILSSGA